MEKDPAAATTTNDADDNDTTSGDHFTSVKRVLLFGEGDFSYTYDFVRCLRQRSSRQRMQIVATGLDSHKEMVAKYKDAPFLLKQLKRLSSNDGGRLTVKVQHDVNALLVDKVSAVLPNAQASCPLSFATADVIVFNHPHIAQENAVLHAQFLSHFFYSVKNWLAGSEDCTSSQGTLYMTLVVGQWERWSGPAAAHRHGWALIHRSPYVDVPLRKGERRYYQLRRHQTGKSFAARRPASEVFCLCLAGGGPLAGSTAPPYPFGDAPPVTSQVPSSHTANPDDTVAPSDLPFVCSLCDKQFAESRSLKNHLQSKHANADTGGVDKEHHYPKRSKMECAQCGRLFGSAQALDDHTQAVHKGVHADLRPSRPAKVPSFATADSKRVQCPICGYAVASLEEHWESLLARRAADRLTWTCSYCHKTLGDDRALRQHENFCHARRQAPATAGEGTGESKKSI